MNLDKNRDSHNSVTMGSYDGAKISELIEIYIQFQIAVFIEGNDSGLHQDDGLISLKNANR